MYSEPDVDVLNGRRTLAERNRQTPVTYASMSNQYHIVVRIDANATTHGPDEEVARRWPLAKVRFSNRALMSSSHCLWHITGRVLAWVTLLFAVGTG